MNNEYVCEVYNKSQEQERKKPVCEWQHKDNTFTFTLMKPEYILKNTFSCEMSKIKPFPVQTREGPKIKLFRGKFTQHGASVNPFYILRNAFKECGIFIWILHFTKINKLYTIFFKGCNKPLAPPKNSCPITNQTYNQDPAPVEKCAPDEMYTLLICGLIIVLVMLSIYSIVLTAVYIRLRVKLIY